MATLVAALALVEPIPWLPLASVQQLALAKEFSKIYCDEYDYILYPEVVLAIEEQLKLKLRNHATTFYNDFILKNGWLPS